MDYSNTKFQLAKEIVQKFNLNGKDSVFVCNSIQKHMDLYFSEMPQVKKFSSMTGCQDVRQAVYCLDMHSWNTGMAVKYFQENAVKVNLQ
ncbi:hypothetical protein [Acinetobacter phage P577]|uniref:hypothetical protein n=1 Tax=Acinetobacter phage YMC13/03/R2096 TaxID=1560342 RepID=UPI00052A4A20|nr:hypothetical protein ACQ36_gp121 [Acinetobacter phage YMC13/03/R2096]AIW02812.1 hypothetical protein BPABA577_00780 [Acinetobacter phage YMC13/03/R2096]WNT46136.1 hypothetical protein [Acinetobacter phage P577]